MTVRRYIVGDCRESMRTLDAGSARCCVTSPPYWGLRDYGNDGQIGLEETPEAYVSALVEVFREVRRVLADDGTLWLNLGDSYAATGASGPHTGLAAHATASDGRRRDKSGPRAQHGLPVRSLGGLKPKNLVGIPWRVAFALQADGWWLRSDIVWAKPNPMPESVRDRPTKAHEYVFLLAKSERYFYDADGVAEPAIHAGVVVKNSGGKNSEMGAFGATRGGFLKAEGVRVKDVRNARSVWSIATQPYAGAHFATMPPTLAQRCIRAGSAVGDVVLDPFGGSGTTARVAEDLGRGWVLCDLSDEYASLAAERTAQLGLLGRTA